MLDEEKVLAGSRRYANIIDNESFSFDIKHVGIVRRRNDAQLGDEVSIRMPSKRNGEDDGD